MDRHLEGAATPEEHLELMALLRNGDMDEMGDHFLQITKARMDMPPPTHSVAELFGRIDTSTPISGRPRVEQPAEVHPSQLSFLPQVRTLATPPAVPEKEDPTEGAFSMKGSGASWLKAAALATVMLGVSLYYFRRSPERFDDAAAAFVKKDPSYTTITGENYFRLPDGSTVLLNTGSTLSYNDSFGANNRKVILSGEAYFDVTHDPAHTFTVHSGGITTAVLGTAFNVKAYDDQVIVTVVNGKVRVSDDARTLATVTPNQQVIVDVTTGETEQVIVNTTAELAWKEPYIILDNTPVTEALRIVSNKYHVPIRLEGDVLRSCHVTSVFLHSETLDDVLMVVTRSFNATYIRKNGAIVIRGGTCNNGEAL